jgi:pyruvate kinase
MAVMANAIEAKAISTMTNSGYTAFQLSAETIYAHILVFTSNRRILTQLSLGLDLTRQDESTDRTVDINDIAKEKVM